MDYSRMLFSSHSVSIGLTRDNPACFHKMQGLSYVATCIEKATEKCTA